VPQTSGKNVLGRPDGMRGKKRRWTKEEEKKAEIRSPPRGKMQSKREEFEVRKKDPAGHGGEKVRDIEEKGG